VNNEKEDKFNDFFDDQFATPAPAATQYMHNYATQIKKRLV
jgi:hypothetical protein